MKKGLFVLSLCLALTLGLVSCSFRESNSLTTGDNGSVSGTYTGSAQGIGGAVELEVVLESGVICAVNITAQNETEGVGSVALDRLITEIVYNQSIAVNAVSGATVSSTAIKEAVSQALEEAGLDLADYSTPVKKVKGEDEEVSCDILIIGGGTSGTAAAIYASRGGAQVLVLEQAATPGGVGALTSAKTYAPGNSLDKTPADQTTADREADLAYLMDYTKYSADKVLLRKWISQCGSVIDTLREENWAFTVFTGHIVKYETRGVQQFLDMYDHLAKTYATEIRCETHGNSLIVENGKLAGALATKPDGSQLTIHCSQIILATGGFGGNEGMMEKLIPGYTNDSTNEGIYEDGSGQQMAWDIGAEVGIAGIQVHNNSLPQIALDAGISTLSGSKIDQVYAFANTPMLWVNRNGDRFANEDIMWSATLSGNVIYREGKVFVVADQTTVNTAMSDATLGLKAWRGDTSVPLTKLQTELNEGIEIGYIFKGDNLSELAERTGMTPDALESTVSRYNKLVNKGVDEDYNKAAEYLKYTVETGPYYAMQLAPRYLGAFGGLTINNNLQVMDTEGHAIEGLYACGFNAESWFGSTYVDFSGVTMSFALTSGAMCAENALAAIQ